MARSDAPCRQDTQVETDANHPDRLNDILARQEMAWKNGPRKSIEELVVDLHASEDRNNALLGLICNEVVLRERDGDKPTLDEYQRRFPELAGALRIQWEIDQLLISRGHASGSATSTKSDSEKFLATKPPPELVNHPRYRVIRPLGRGGMGMVWLAQHLVMDRPVALKMIRPELLAKPGTMDRFKREIQAAAKLHHPNIVTAFDAEQFDGTHFLVVEFVEGQTLAQRVKQSPLSVAEACRAISDAAHGLAHAHASGLVHRDVKPGNLMMTKSGQLKVLDFGLVFDPREDPSITGENMVMGTPDYVSPEQAEDPHAADARSDIYSLGCTLFHLLSGKPPFTESSLLKKMDAHRNREPEKLAEIPLGLQEILSKMMAKAPENRFQSAQDVIEALAPYCASNSDIWSLQSSYPPSRRRLTHRLILMACLGVMAGLVLANRARIGSWIEISLDQGGNHLPLVVPDPSHGSLPEEGKEFVPGDRLPLLVPTSVGDGTEKDYSIDGNMLTLDAKTRVPQVWLNYKTLESNRLSIRARIRLNEVGQYSVLKLVFLADGVSDISLVVFPTDRVLIIEEASWKGTVTLADCKLADRLLQDWMDVEFQYLDGKLLARVNGKLMLEGKSERPAARYPSIAALHCQAELLDPSVLRLE